MDARPDGRAVVYTHIQADPLVANGWIYGYDTDAALTDGG